MQIYAHVGWGGGCCPTVRASNPSGGKRETGLEKTSQAWDPVLLISSCLRLWGQKSWPCPVPSTSASLSGSLPHPEPHTITHWGQVLSDVGTIPSPPTPTPPPPHSRLPQSPSLSALCKGSCVPVGWGRSSLTHLPDYLSPGTTCRMTYV